MIFTFLEIIFSLAVFLLIFKVSFHRQSIKQLLILSIKNIFQEHKFFVPLLLMIILLILNTLRVHYENFFYLHRLKEITNLAMRIEGDWISKIQTSNKFIISFFLFFYIVIYSAQLYGTAIILVALNKKRGFYVFLLSLMLALSMAIPIYLLFPIREPWMAYPGKIFLLPNLININILKNIHNVGAGFYDGLPSLHITYVTITILIYAYLKVKKLFFITFINGIIIAFSTMFLGIHWAVDFFAGIICGVIAFTIAKLIVKKYEVIKNGFPPILEQLKSKLNNKDER